MNKVQSNVVAHEMDRTDRQVAEQLEHESPEGRPAHPELGTRRLRVILMLISLVAVVAGILISIFYQPLTGVVVAILGIILVLFNPLFWVAVLRGREVDETRAEVKEGGAAAARPNHGHTRS